MKMGVIHATATTMTLAKSKINDDKMEIENWFKGFEKGLERLSPEQRSVFFSECGRNCVNVPKATWTPSFRWLMNCKV